MLVHVCQSQTLSTIRCSSASGRGGGREGACALAGGSAHLPLARRSIAPPHLPRRPHRLRCAGNNWAHGHHFYGPQYRDAILGKVRRTVEGCDSLQSFLLLHSLGGGTGSGLGTYILQSLADECARARPPPPPPPLAAPAARSHLCLQNTPMPRLLPPISRLPVLPNP